MRFEFVGREEHIVFSDYGKAYFSVDLISGNEANALEDFQCGLKLD